MANVYFTKDLSSEALIKLYRALNIKLQAQIAFPQIDY